MEWGHGWRWTPSGSISLQVQRSGRRGWGISGRGHCSLWACLSLSGFLVFGCVSLSVYSGYFLSMEHLSAASPSFPSASTCFPSFWAMWLGHVAEPTYLTSHLSLALVSRCTPRTRTQVPLSMAGSPTSHEASLPGTAFHGLGVHEVLQTHGWQSPGLGSLFASVPDSFPSARQVVPGLRPFSLNNLRFW